MEGRSLQPHSERRINLLSLWFLLCTLLLVACGGSAASGAGGGVATGGGLTRALCTPQEGKAAKALLDADVQQLQAVVTLYNNAGITYPASADQLIAKAPLANAAYLDLGARVERERQAAFDCSQAAYQAFTRYMNDTVHLSMRIAYPVVTSATVETDRRQLQAALSDLVTAR